MFSKHEIADYYNTTQNHYEKWWDLHKSHALHYGIWEEGTRNFQEALRNTNQAMVELAGLKSTDRLLDAGCGVGGTAVYAHRQKGAKVTGITLSERQLTTARSLVAEQGLGGQVDFQLMDFTQTSFPDESFDVVWACESVCHAEDPKEFMQEAQRILKKGGRLVVLDFFKSAADQEDKNDWLQKWCATWAVPGLVTAEHFAKGLEQSGFTEMRVRNYTAEVRKSARRMYYAALLAVLPSEAYKIINPQVSRFARNHYKCGIYQYRALGADLWQYCAVTAKKR